MAKIVLIHGYSVGSKFWLFRPNLIQDGGFSAFKEELELGTAKVFFWYLLRNYNFFQSIFQIDNVKTYFLERQKSVILELNRELSLFLEKENPEVIICHSLGCRLFINTLNQFGYNPALKKVVTLNSDAEKNLEIKDKLTITRINSGQLIWQNVYCFWDPTLWLSLILNRKIPQGLFGGQKLLKNIFVPLWGSLNLHTAAITTARVKKIYLETGE